MTTENTTQYIKIGDRIRSARRAKKLTQQQLAERINATSHCIISDYERGKRGFKRPNLQFLLKIAEVLEVRIDWLFLGKHEV